jgi:RNA polymerase sigma factor for flagellar operon FliA
MMTCCEAPEKRAVKTEARPTAQALWKRYHQNTDTGSDTSTENALVEQYLPLVSSLLGRLAMTLPDHVSQDDLRSAGLIGLLQALRNFDPSSGNSFETYARVRIRGAMLDELRRMDWVPRTVHEKARKIQKIISELEQKFNGPPTEAQVAKALNISIAEYTKMLEEVRPAAFVCLDAVSSSENGDMGSLYEVVADTSEEGPDEQTSRRDLQQVVLNRLKELPDIQRKVLALYYGEDLHLREIAEAIGLTESRICQIHSQAIFAIRAYVQRFEAGLVRPAAASINHNSRVGKQVAVANASRYAVQHQLPIAEAAA